MGKVSGKMTVPVITGPTASGKSALAHRLALETGAEIVSADSRQIYRELTIGSAKPSREMLQEVAYHFINERAITEPFSAGAFALEATARIREIKRRGKRVIVAGGSALYLEGLISPFAELPPQNAEIRRKLSEQLADLGGELLYERLKQLDPEQAETLDPTKTHRLLRSLEIIEITGRTVTELQAKKSGEPSAPSSLHFKTFAIDIPREELYRQINRRTESMMEEGLLIEAEQLWKRYRIEIENKSLPALLTVGYQELFDHFRGRTTLDEAVTLIQQHTRNYAKRQLTFMRNRLTLQWLQPDTGGKVRIPD